MELLMLLVGACLLPLVSKLTELWIEYYSGLFQRGIQDGPVLSSSVL
jgi:hypothetical protein